MKFHFQHKIDYLSCLQIKIVKINARLFMFVLNKNAKQVITLKWNNFLSIVIESKFL